MEQNEIRFQLFSRRIYIYIYVFLPKEKENVINI